MRTPAGELALMVPISNLLTGAQPCASDARSIHNISFHCAVEYSRGLKRIDHL